MDKRFIIPVLFLGLCSFSDEKVVLSGEPTSVIENKTYALFCTTSESQAWTAEWFMNGNNVHTVTRTSKGGNDCSSSTAIHVQNTNIPVTGTCIQPGTSFKLTFQSMPAVLNNSRWECSLDDVKSGAFKVNVTEKHKIKINVIPNNGLTTHEVRLTEGEEVNITCSTEPHISGSLTYSLVLAGRRSTKSLIPQENTNLVARATWSVVREYTYISCTVKKNGQWLSEDGLRMNILYVPTVLVSIRNGSQLIHQGNITLFCNITANPYVKEVFWRHFMNGRLIREFKKYAPESILNLNDVTNEDDGDYYCNVTNDISEGFSHNSTQIRIKGSPVVLTPNTAIYKRKIMDRVRLKIMYLDSTAVNNETWLFEGEEIPFDAVQESKNVNIQFVMHEVPVTRRGYEATLILSHLASDYSGNYSLLICNGYGCSQSDPLTLMVSGPWEPTRLYMYILIPLCVTVGLLLLIALPIYFKRRRHSDEPPPPITAGEEIEITNYEHLRDIPEPHRVYDKLVSKKHKR